MIGSAIFLWERHQETIVNLEEFSLTQEKIALTPQPHWSELDLKEMVLDQSNGEQASILDTELVPRTAGIMKQVGFVEQINSIEKSKSGLNIDVIYRQPIALVELSAGNDEKQVAFQSNGQNGFVTGRPQWGPNA